MKRWKKSDTCLNCGKSISVDFNYCPHCGQENDDRNISFLKLISEFFSNYLSLDSRFGRSIIPFLINPGFLTNRFNQGKRKNYANPIRLYLVVSLFYFFLMSLYLDQHSELFSEDNQAFANPVPDSVKLEQIPEDIITDINDAFVKADSLNLDSLGVDEKKFNQFRSKFDSTGFKVPTLGDSIFNDDSGWPMTNAQWRIFRGMKNDLNYSTQDILDSMHVEQMDPTRAKLTRQIVRVGRSSDTFFEYALKNLPIMMFLMLPLFALILKFLYVTRKILYIQHLIHSLHIHSVAFFFYGLAFLVALIFDPNIVNVTLIIALILVTLYSYISYITVYKQHWFKTLVKFALTGWMYGFVLSIGLAIEIAASFWLY
ncbi:MAG: DUF3667 domain-containing protein [bacterium]|nr:DUF3667 domain-containing protein [bacterium]